LVVVAVSILFSSPVHTFATLHHVHVLDLYEPLDIIGNGTFGVTRRVMSTLDIRKKRSQP